MSELRRMRRHRLTRAALVVLTLVPLLYGALYLAAFWDPYGNLKRIPVALVLEDQPTGDVHAGQDLADRLIDRQVFGWVRTDRAAAEAGLADGSYDLVLRIPADFSSALVTPPAPETAARAGQLIVTSDDATNYLSGLLARSAFTEIRASAAAGVSATYFERMLIGFGDLKTQTGKAADGASQLADGTSRLRDGAGRLGSGASRAASGAGTLADGLADASDGAASLATGLATLEAGSAQLAEGADRAAAGGRRLAAMVDRAADATEPVLREHAGEIARAATAIADGADAVADHLDELPALAEVAVRRTGEVVSKLDAYADAHPDAAVDPVFIAARQAAADAAASALRLRTRADLGSLGDSLHRVAALARQVAEAAPRLADDIAAARAQVDQLAAGLTALSTGAHNLVEGTHTAATGARDLRGGLYRLATGARQLDGGLADLTDGTKQLATGLATLDDGARSLATGLADGAAQIPGYDVDGAAARAGVLADPVALQRDTKHAAASYGVGFAPYFLALALWVGCMVTYMLLRPLNRRNVMSGAPAWRVAFGGWLPGFTIGAAQAALLYAVLVGLLGLRPVHPVATLGFLLLTTAAFTSILQLIGARLGAAGRVVALVLLMLQLTSSGGTYPVATSPAFFRALHPFMPMTYVVDGLRHLLVGGSATVVWVGAGVLAAITVAAFALTTLTARRQRVLTPSALHPALTM
ncbi:putative membrane protein [Allocatelliglobosispora scoriae]|uniref:Putative membrane protein n=1 Tax=Allocatelliglobosispora scoriae TaxID=643052 RepID=A0A841C0G3_9ACTN|nr:YhgE/Pip domain-containing protein [Allocatelliglobosispora scoriae]MBB5872440.1 putative membrane protein [Allocatelliglobosispora scoriae]